MLLPQAVSPGSTQVGLLRDIRDLSTVDQSPVANEASDSPLSVDQPCDRRAKAAADVLSMAFAAILTQFFTYISRWSKRGLAYGRAAVRLFFELFYLLFLHLLRPVRFFCVFEPPGSFRNTRCFERADILAENSSVVKSLECRYDARRYVDAD